MERIQRDVNMAFPEERMLFDPPRMDTPIVIARAVVRNRRIAHFIWVVATAISAMLVYITFAGPASLIQVLAQPTIVTDGRMVRQEERVESLVALVAGHSTKIELLTADHIRLAAELEGAEKTIKFGGGLIVALNIIAAWFSRQKK